MVDRLMRFFNSIKFMIGIKAKAKLVSYETLPRFIA